MFFGLTRAALAVTSACYSVVFLKYKNVLGAPNYSNKKIRTNRRVCYLYSIPNREGDEEKFRMFLRLKKTI